MLKYTHIKNFQSHKDTTIEFSSNVTAIVGLNNNGKSAIFRALQKVIRNIPDGKLFISDWSNSCEIILATDLGVITRSVKSTNTNDANKYSVNEVDFVKFKTTIPVEVKEKFTVSDIQKFGDVEFDLNFQNQFDDEFLVVGSGLASVRGKILGRIIKTDSVQRAVQLASSSEKSLVQEYKYNKEQKEKLSLQLVKYNFLDNVIVCYSGVKEKLDVLEIKKNKIDKLKSILSDILIITKKAKLCKVKLSYLNIIPGVDKIIATKHVLEVCKNALNIYESFKRVKVLSKVQIDVDTKDIKDKINTLRLCRDLLVKHKKIDSLNIYIDFFNLPNITNVLKKMNYFIKLEGYHEFTDDCSCSIEEKNNVLYTTEYTLLAVVNELDKFKVELGVCPLCNQTFKNCEEKI